jgi:DNA-binding SARP family transcriptional activator
VNGSIHFGVLGPVVIGDATALRPQTRSVLAVLLTHRGEPVSAEYLIDAIWCGEPSRSARTQLHGHISRLRRLMCGRDSQIETYSHGYVLRCAPEEVDMEVFRTSVWEGRRLMGVDPQGAVAGIMQALGLWRGPAFAAVEVEPVRACADELEELRLQAIEDAAEAAMACDSHPQAVTRLTSVVRRWPFRERARALLMTALARSGRTADALTLYQSGRRLLINELGIEPSEALQRVHHCVLIGTAGFRPQELLPSSRD